MPDYIPPPPTLPPGSIVWAYLRDSGGPKQDRSTDQQLAVIESYCTQHGLALARVYRDVARSGKTTEGREELAALREDSAAPGRAAGLLVWDFSRLARDIDDAQYIKSTLRKNGLVIHSLNDAIPEGKEGRIFEALKDLGAQQERERMVRNVKRGLQSTFEKGFSFGSPPRGYKIQWVEVSKTREGKPRELACWVIDPDLADLVKLAWAMRAEGRSLSDIRKATGLYSGKNAYTHFFRNKAYLGIGQRGDQEIPDHHPALIDRATWDAVQIINAETSRLAGRYHPRRVSSTALLSGLTYCTQCGAAMMHTLIGATRWACYLCGNKSRKGESTCPSRRVNAKLAEAAILQAILGEVLTVDFIGAWLDQTQSLLFNRPALEKQTDKLQKDLAQNEQAIKHLLDLVEVEGAAKAQERITQREAEQARLRLQLQDLQDRRKLADITLTPEALQVILQTWLNQFEAAQGEGPQALRNFIRRFVTRIELDYNNATIQYTYPYSALITWQSKRVNPAAFGGSSLYTCDLGALAKLTITWE